MCAAKEAPADSASSRAIHSAGGTSRERSIRWLRNAPARVPGAGSSPADRITLEIERLALHSRPSCGHYTPRRRPRLPHWPIFSTPSAQDDLAAAPDFTPVNGDDWVDVVARNLWLRDAEVDVFAGAGPLITDDRPRTEYHLLRRLFATGTRNIWSRAAAGRAVAA